MPVLRNPTQDSLIALLKKLGEPQENPVKVNPRNPLRVGHTYTLKRDAGPVPAGTKVVLQGTPATGKTMAWVSPISHEWQKALKSVKRTDKFRVPFWVLG